MYLVASGGQRSAIVWPATTSWDAETEEVVLPIGARVADGEKVEGGGGARDVAWVERMLGREAADRLSECFDGSSPEVAVVNNNRDGIKKDY